MELDINQIREEYPNEFILSKEFDLKTKSGQRGYIRIKKAMERGDVKEIITRYGSAVNREELAKFLDKDDIRGIRQGIKIDLSPENNSSTIKCLYKRIGFMNKKNQQIIKKDNKFKRYQDENNHLYINIKDYIQPQIRMIASKLECSENKVWKHLFELLKEINE